MIPLHQPLNLIDGVLLCQMPSIDLIQLMPHPQYLFGMDGDVAGLSEIAPGRLMHHYRGVRQAVSFARRAAAQEEGAHGGSLAHADGCDWGLDVGHCVVDG